MDRFFSVGLERKRERKWRDRGENRLKTSSATVLEPKICFELSHMRRLVPAWSSSPLLFVSCLEGWTLPCVVVCQAVPNVRRSGGKGRVSGPLALHAAMMASLWMSCLWYLYRSVQGVAVWIALNRRSNGMTGRSVMTQGSTGLRTTEVGAHERTVFCFSVLWRHVGDLKLTSSRCV